MKEREKMEVIILVLILIYVSRIEYFFRGAGKEQKLIRFEAGKLAEEVHLLRQELQQNGKEKHE